MKQNKFSKFIEHVLVCLPLVYVAVVTAYTIFNKNAKDSYYGETINDVETLPVDTFVSGDVYNFNSTLGVNTFVDNVDYLISDITNIDTNITFQGIENANQLRFRSYQGALTFNLYNNNTYMTSFTSGGNQYLSFDFVFNGVNRSGYTDFFVQYVYNEYSYLNNALPYAMTEFNKLGFGKIDFVGWFLNIFMTGNTNNVYVTFINSYLNYFLFAEVCYFIPMIFYWFIHFGERVIDRLSRKDY